MNADEELTPDELENAAGGAVNKNITPGSMGGSAINIVDKEVNRPVYNAIATAIAHKLQPPPPRSRAVNNEVDIYDCDV